MKSNLHLGLWLLLGGIACSEGPSDLKSTFSIGNKDTPVTREINPDSTELESGKASDDDEGIPGYMANIAGIEASIQENIYQVSAPQGTVIHDIQREVFATYWVIGADAIDTNRKTIIAGQNINAAFLGSSPVAQNGSFYVETSEPIENQRIIITFSYDPSPEVLTFTSPDVNRFAGVYLNKEVIETKEENKQRNQFPGAPGPGRQHGGNHQNDPVITTTTVLKVEGLIASDPALMP